jgi:uncharacterized caspase-like protein
MFGRRLGRLCVALVAVGLTAAVTTAQEPAPKLTNRVALVIGNGAYAETYKLPNPPNDAADVAATLEDLGFKVVEVVDGDHQAMRRAFRNFSLLLDQAQVALFYYAGHGLQVKGRNYLVPIDAKLVREEDLKFEAFAVDEFPLELMETSPAGVKLVVLDACRDNPLATRLMRSIGGAGRSTAIGRGLAPLRLERAAGTLIAYATNPGNVAADGTGRNSPFTTAFLEWVDEPGLEVGLMFRRVREAVMEATGGRQVPWVNEALLGEFYFRQTTVAQEERPPDAGLATTPRPGAAQHDRQAKEPAAADADAFELTFWNSIKDSDDPRAFEEYLNQYPEGRFAGLARLQIETGETADEPQVALVAPPPPRPELQPVEATYVAVKTANVREEPTVRSATVGQLAPGTEVHVAGKVRDRNWYLVEQDGRPLGYVYGELLQEPEAPRIALAPPAVPEHERPADPAVGVFPSRPPSAEAYRSLDDPKLRAVLGPLDTPFEAALNQLRMVDGVIYAVGAPERHKLVFENVRIAGFGGTLELVGQIDELAQAVDVRVAFAGLQPGMAAGLLPEDISRDIANRFGVLDGAITATGPFDALEIGFERVAGFGGAFGISGTVIAQPDGVTLDLRLDGREIAPRTFAGLVAGLVADPQAKQALLEFRQLEGTVRVTGTDRAFDLAYDMRAQGVGGTFALTGTMTSLPDRPILDYTLALQRIQPRRLARLFDEAEARSLVAQITAISGEIAARGPPEEQDFDLRGVEISAFGGKVAISGSITDTAVEPRLNLDLDIVDVDASTFARALGSRYRPRVRLGSLSLAARIVGSPGSRVDATGLTGRIEYIDNAGNARLGAFAGDIRASANAPPSGMTLDLSAGGSDAGVRELRRLFDLTDAPQ